MSDLQVSREDKDVESNPRGIPKAPFISDVATYLGGEDRPIDNAMEKLQELSAKYKYMTLSTARRKRGLEEKIPEMKQSVDMVTFLKDMDPDNSMKTTFELNDTIYASANIDKPDQVYLWLGANVMLAYPPAEAVALLEEKLKSAQEEVDKCAQDAEWLRDQTTTVDVNMSRLWNWDVVRRRKLKESESVDA